VNNNNPVVGTSPIFGADLIKVVRPQATNIIYRKQQNLVTDPESSDILTPAAPCRVSARRAHSREGPQRLLHMAEDGGRELLVVERSLAQKLHAQAGPRGPGATMAAMTAMAVGMSIGGC